MSPASEVRKAESPSSGQHARAVLRNTRMVPRSIPQRGEGIECQRGDLVGVNFLRLLPSFHRLPSIRVHRPPGPRRTPAVKIGLDRRSGS